MDDLAQNVQTIPGTLNRPKSMCLSDIRSYSLGSNEQNYFNEYLPSSNYDNNAPQFGRDNTGKFYDIERVENGRQKGLLSKFNRIFDPEKKKKGLKRNPVQRAASRLYRAGRKVPLLYGNSLHERDCVGPEFVVRAALPCKQFTMADVKGNVKKSVVVIMLNGQKVEVLCNPNTTTAGQLFEVSFLY